MRKQVQRQILAVLETMGEGLEGMNPADPESAFTALNDGYGGAAVVKDALEQSLSDARACFYGEALEHFMALLQKANDKLQTGGDFAAETGQALAALAEVRAALEGEAEVTTSVVFFPYKASMWDSLESIWRAAVADPACEAVVVPIPYYDKNPDGSFAGQHYEGGDFPPEVPVLDYRQFDLAAWQPDIAYIHNPYDARNYVTSVDPAYYSTELKKHVGTLVYVPYYVSTGDGTPEFNEMAAACAADVLVAANQKDAEALEALAPQKKVLLGGSPKIDRVLALDAAPPPMPPEWAGKLAGKKVFLLNTSIQSMLQHGKNYLKKLAETFELFEKTPGVALLWRPHPLLASTIDSMRPEYTKVYGALVDRIKRGEFGVYDDSSDVDRAIAIADAYIGDAVSSLVYMFSLTGKPAYAFNYALPGGSFSLQADEQAVRVESVYTKGARDGVGFAFSDHRNAFFRYDLNTGEVEDLFSVEEEPPGLNLFGYALRVGEQVVLPPLYGHGFVVADLQQEGYRYLPLPKEVEWPAVFSSGEAEGEKAWFVSASGGRVACVDTVIGEVSYFNPTGWPEEADPPQTSNVGCAVDGILYRPVRNAPYILAFDMKEKKITFHRVGRGEAGFQDIVFDGVAFWLCQNKSFCGREQPEALVRWDAATDKVRYYGSFPEGFVPSEENEFDDYTVFSTLATMGGRLLAFPNTANMAVALDMQTGTTEQFPLELSFDITKRRSARYRAPGNLSFQHMRGERLCLWAGYDFGYYQLEAKTGRLVSETRLLANPPGGPAQLTDPLNFRIGALHWQYPLFSLEDFVRELQVGRVPARDPAQAREKRGQVACGDGGSGSTIHREVMALQKQT